MRSTNCGCIRGLYIQNIVQVIIPELYRSQEIYFDKMQKRAIIIYELWTTKNNTLLLMPRHPIKPCKKLQPDQVTLIPIQPRIASHLPMLSEEDVISTVAKFSDVDGKKVKDTILDARAVPSEIYEKAPDGIICTLERTICLVRFEKGRIITLGRYFKRGCSIAVPVTQHPKHDVDARTERNLEKLFS